MLAYFANLISALVASGSASAVVVSLFARKSRKERDSEVEAAQTNTGKVSAEVYELILDRLHKELTAAYADVDRRVEIADAQELRIDQQNEEADILNSHIDDLEDWIKVARRQLKDQGVDSSPVPRMTINRHYRDDLDAKE